MNERPRQVSTRSTLNLLIIVLIVGIIMTAFSLFYVQKTESTITCEWTSLNQVERGYPFPMVEINPSVSLCNPVESITVLWRGNAIHQEFIGNIAKNVIFWSVALAATITGSKVLTKALKK